MRNSLLLAALAAAVLVAVPNDGDACGRRRCAAPCRPAPVVWYYAPACPSPPVWGTAPVFAPTAAAAAPAQLPARTVRIGRKTYRIIAHPDRGTEREDERDVATATLPPGAAGSNIPSWDRFAGTARRQPKTTIFNGPVEDFPTVSALLDSLPPNEEMKGTIASTPTTNRVKKEQRNVRVKAYIYAFKKEADNDYHVLVGDSPDGENVRFLNTEVSGIPIAGTDENRKRLAAVRNTFKAKFELGRTGPASYHRPDPPVPVRITGSLFWDVDHEDPPYVGPNDLKPMTPWEIHPISAIEFLDE